MPEVENAADGGSPKIPTRSSPTPPHTLPSVEFTFSCSPSSAGRLTPTSSVDDTESIDPGLSQRSVTLTTQNLFQNLRLSESAPPANDTGPKVTPTSAHATYRNLFNATPSPATPRTSTQRPRSPTSPLGHVNSNFQNLNIDDSENEESDDNSDSNSLQSSDSESETDEENDQYNIRQEELPKAPIYDLRLQSALRDVCNQLGSLAQLMGQRGDLIRDPESALHELHAQTLAASRFSYPETRTVGFIGDSGMDQKGLARSSGDGAACTTVVTEFRGTDESHPQNYTVEADFMDQTEIRELLEELLACVRKYYTNAFRQVIVAAEQESIKTAAKRAWDTLRSLFPRQPDFDLEFLSTEGEDAVEPILGTLMGWAVAGLAHRPGGRDSLRYTTVARHAGECMEQLDVLTADPRDSEMPALWPFVKLIRVYLRSPVLRTGLVLADLPGFRDLNFARVRATERYLRHSCHEVFVVSTIHRCTTDKSIGDIIGRCARDQPVRMVCTCSENVDAEETARTATQADATRIRQIADRIQDLERRIRRTRTRRKQAPEKKKKGRLLLLSEQKEVAEFELNRFLITRRNTRVTNALIRAWGEKARVFCVSNRLYADHRENDAEQASQYLELSGIKELRRYCQSVPAEAQFRATEAFLQNQVPGLLGSITQWALAGSNAVTVSRAEVLRAVLTAAEATLRQWHSASYSAFCRNYGTHTTQKVGPRCWNIEVLGAGRDQLYSGWETILEWLIENAEWLEEEVSDAFGVVRESIKGHHNMASEALDNLLRNLQTRERCILDAIRSSLGGLIYATEKTKDDTVGGHSSSYIAGIMRPVYNHCREEGGTGSDARRKQAMNRHLSSSRLFMDFAGVIEGDYKALIEETFGALDTKLREEIANVTRDLRAAVTVEGEVPEAGQNRRHTEELKRGLERLKTRLAEAQTTLRELGQQSN
ncbi:hypothetical protein BO71DRAFT_424076 [Aspergillus ellipticus CBS 707.79]|uniref:DUF7605 domain-containing protein n=1 Tax=Aspergillus ellipticus CBS 707.79 TaxID=1448320 RepID=A0A319CU11_9EURO|nr:hypothetical protein BO71DRAFT_424076 [Aspergillus ellipticus CBS 707.79]